LGGVRAGQQLRRGRRAAPAQQVEPPLGKGVGVAPGTAAPAAPGPAAPVPALPLAASPPLRAVHLARGSVSPAGGPPFLTAGTAFLAVRGASLAVRAARRAGLSGTIFPVLGIPAAARSLRHVCPSFRPATMAASRRREQDPAAWCWHRSAGSATPRTRL